MKVRAVIEKLETFDPDKDLLIAVYTSTQGYSVAQCEIVREQIDTAYDGATIHVWLPDGMYVVDKNKRGVPAALRMKGGAL